MKRLFKPLGRISRLSQIAADHESVTDHGPEADEVAAGLKPGSVDVMWGRMCALYDTGVQPGFQLCIAHGGEIVLNRAIGHARGNAPLEHMAGNSPQPMQCDTPVNLFSAAKAVTAMLVHKLAEQGYFSIDDPVARHIPGFERHGKAAIRIRDVLTHRAGLTKMPASAAGFADLDILADPDAIREMVLDLQPQGKIGGPPAYHAITGGFVLAELMQAVTGESPRTLLDTHIKQPLGLRWLDFGAAPADVEKIALNAETGWIPGPIAWHLGRVVGAPFNEAIHISNDPRFLSAIIPSGNVLSTAQDMAVFYQCLLDQGRYQGKQIFKPETVQQAIAADSPSTMPSIDRVIGIPIRYSPGFMLGHKGVGLYGWNRTSTFGHFGFTSTLTWARPDTGTVVALLTNGKPILGPHITEMLGMFHAFNAFSENRIAG
ncbi:MAG: serine hydrolase domain-containing protein [Nevskiales bacterium]